MTSDSVVKRIMDLPEMKALVVQYEADKLRSAVKNAIGPAETYITSCYSWPFVMDTQDFSGGTTSGTADYELPGSDKNVHTVVSVIYGDNLDLLKHRTLDHMDDLTSRYTVSGVGYWAVAAQEAGLVTIRLYATPASDSKTIRYRYKRSDVKLSEWPDEFQELLKAAVARDFVPRYEGVFNRELARLAGIYSPIPSDADPAPLDWQTTRLNNDRARQMNWGN